MGLSPVIQVLVDKYCSRKAGKRADAERDLILPLAELLKAAKADYGHARDEALSALKQLQDVLVLRHHNKDASEILDVRLPREKEPEFFSRIGLESPTQLRERLASHFCSAAEFPLPETFARQWRIYCEQKSRDARSGTSIHPFDRKNEAEIQQILSVLPKLLAWKGESYLRFASSVLLGDSKELEHLQSKLESCLTELTGGQITSLADLNLIENERSLLLHGPVKLVTANGILDLGLLTSPARIAVTDIASAVTLETNAKRCITVENASMLHELAKLRSDVILASSGSEGGFANRAVVQLLRSLPQNVACYHFGDSDPAGYDILRNLREKAQRPIASLHMHYRPAKDAPLLDSKDVQTIDRLLNSPHITAEEKNQLLQMRSAGNKGAFEQESLGRPNPEWPFYPLPGFCSSR